MEFNFPPAPTRLVFPHTAHVAANAYIWAVAGVLALLAVRELYRSRSALGLVLMVGGALAYFNEPVDDILGLVWHPRIHQDTVLNTIGPIPMWGLPTYIIFFGAIPWLLLRELRRGRFTIKKYWIGVLLTFAADLLIEIPLLQTNLYAYYAHGQVPMSIGRLPLYWLMINTTGPIFCAAILFGAPGYFTGIRRPLLILLPVVADASCSIAVGLPVYSALHAPHVSALVRWLGAGLSMLIGFVILDALARWIMYRTTVLQSEVETTSTTVSRQSVRSRSMAAP